jgi:xylan 1,4-beta-xylosidase
MHFSRRGDARMKKSSRIDIRPAVSLLTAILWLQVLASNSEITCTGDTVRIWADLGVVKGPMDPVWAWFGYDEPNYTCMKDGKKLLSELAALSPVPVHVRMHNLLNSGDGEPALKWGSTNVYTEDQAGNPVYDWTVIDKIFDTLIERGMKPLAEIGFMPEALSIKPRPYRHAWSPDQPYQNIFTGWTQPPKDYAKWADLIRRWVGHSVERYGEKEVASWLWELWNEPDAPYWGGTVEEYCQLYDFTADAVKRALPGAKIGGPHVTGPAGEKARVFLRAFLEHCRRGRNAATGETGSPLDFIAFHAKGAPRVIDGSVRMDLGRQLRDISMGFETVASFAPYKNLPVVIGESDPEGCAACSQKMHPQNAYRNGTMYSSYTAAAFARKYELADLYRVRFTGAVSWSFEFENQPWFDGFRDLATNGVDKPVLNVFRMFGLMTGSRVRVGGDRAYHFTAVRDSSVRGPRPDIDALACVDENAASIMIWNYHDDDVPAAPSPVELTVRRIPARKALLLHYRIDGEHSNSYEAWKRMGSPGNPTMVQIAALERSGQLEMLSSPAWIDVSGGKVLIRMDLPRQGVSLIRMEWKIEY